MDVTTWTTACLLHVHHALVGLQTSCITQFETIAPTLETTTSKPQRKRMMRGCVKIVFSFLHFWFFIVTPLAWESDVFLSSDFRDTLRFPSHAGCLINRLFQTNRRTREDCRVNMEWIVRAVVRFASTAGGCDIRRLWKWRCRLWMRRFGSHNGNHETGGRVVV
jgi:hypothetical protein